MNQDRNTNPDDISRHDFWKAAYITFLDESPALAHEFFSERPMEMRGRRYQGAALLEHLWSAKADISMDWNYAGVDALERFLIDHGRDPLAFMRKLLFRNNRATYMPGKTVLSWFYPVMEIFRNYDPREMVFKLIAVFTESYLPGHLHRRFRKDVCGDWLYSYLFYSTDKSFMTIRKFNFDLIAGEQIKAAPRILDLPEFEELAYRSDCRDLEELIWTGNAHRSGDALMLDGKAVAQRTGFHAFASELDLPIEKWSIPDFPVYLADRDIRCPIRNRVVIYEGCVYGAPGYISVVKHRAMEASERKFLRHLIADAEAEEDLLGPELKRRHLEVLERLRESARFTWHEEDESFDLQGKPFIKGIPARILKHVLEAYLADGRVEFEFRELKRCFDITLGQKNANFEIRLARLAEKLSKESGCVAIEKAGRGRFRLQVTGRIELRPGHGSYAAPGNFR